MDKRPVLLKYYRRLFKHYGPQRWWPAQSPFEVMVGAILTQNTNWTNVEKAIANLKSYNLLDPHRMIETDPALLAQLIRPSGYFNVKTRRLIEFVRWFVDHYEGSVAALKRREFSSLREELLSIRGIGRETADSILLYALGHPTFVVDAYTYRIFSRHLLIPEETDYDEIKGLFEQNLPRQEKLFNDYHAQIVAVGKEFCRTKALCQKCPLKPYLPR